MTAKTCAQCGCGHEDPSGSLPHADGNPYPQYSPEHRVWAIAQQHGRAAERPVYLEKDLLADAGWVPHDGTVLASELVAQYHRDVEQAARS